MIIKEITEDLTFANDGEVFTKSEVHYSAASGLAALDKIEEETIKQMYEEAQAAIEADTDPRSQRYIMRLDTKKLVQSEAEYGLCISKGVSLKYGITYGHAIQLLAKEDADKRKRLKAKKKAKTAKASRKKNR